MQVWVNEGVGLDYWLDYHCEFKEPGVYVVDGIHAVYHRGDGWSTDDDEDWYFDSIRPATPEEIAARALSEVEEIVKPVAETSE